MCDNRPTDIYIILNHHIALALIGFKLHFNLKLSKLPQKVQNFRLSTPHNFGLVTGLYT